MVFMISNFQLIRAMVITNSCSPAMALKSELICQVLLIISNSLVTKAIPILSINSCYVSSLPVQSSKMLLCPFIISRWLLLRGMPLGVREWSLDCSRP
jgi:hypothetical protein